MNNPLTKRNGISFYKFFVLLFFTLLYNVHSNAQVKSFPSAYGAGAYTTGGRGGEVVHVTNLNDSGFGSLRYAMQMEIPRTIVFDVSGVIRLDTFLYMGPNNGNVTIAGQTAPEGGITIEGHRVFMESVDNVICRYIRFRGGIDAEGFGYQKNDSFTAAGSTTNHIFDHCSFSFDGDETSDWSAASGNYTINNVTVQRCIMGEGEKGVLFGGQPSVTTGEMSFHHSLFYNITHRTPNIAGYNGAKIETINNVVWTIDNRLIRTDGNPEWNHINNYYDFGNTPVSDGRLNMQTSIDSDPPSIYTNGNKIVSVNTINPLTYNVAQLNADNKLMHRYFLVGEGHLIGELLNSNYFTDTQHPLLGAPIPVQSADEAFDSVKSDVGCNSRLNADGSVSDNKDVLDAGWLANINNGVYVPRADSSTWSVPNIVSQNRPDNFYVSNPHIPEIWFQANVPEGQDHNDIAPSGYTWLEEYLNQVDASLVSIGLESITVTPNSAEVLITDTLQLTATFIPENATNRNGIWTSSDEDIAIVDSNGLVTPVSLGDVTITFTAADGGFTDTSEITVFPEALLASASDDQQICAGESITLTASGGTNYMWNTGETTASIEVAPVETIVYTVTVSDDNEQSEAINVTVTVNAVPIADAGEDQTLCFGESTILTATGGDSYLWSTGETTSSIEVTPSVETTYSVETFSNNCSSTDSVTVFISEAPEITVTEDLIIVEGQSTTLTATGSDNFEWSTGETTASITVSPNNTTTYLVNTTNVNGCSSSASVTVTVVPEIMASAGEDVTICNGESVILNASGATTYLWNTGDLGSELMVSPTETTTYIVTAEDAYGFTDTAQVTVNVNEAPVLTVSDDIYVMIGSSTTLSVSGASTYIWNTGETASEIIVSPEVTTTYTVTGFSESGCQSSVDVLVTVVEELNANAGQDQSICLGDSVTLDATGGVTYTWNTGDTGASLTLVPTETATYTVTVTDGFGNSDSDEVTVTVNPSPVANAGEDQSTCLGESVVLTAQGGDSYLWSTGETTETITVNPNEDTVYSVEVFSGTCSDTDEVQVFVLPTPELTINDDVVIMMGMSTTLEVFGANSYLWNTGEVSSSITVSPTDTTTYTVTGYLENGCESVAQVTVTIVPEVIAFAGEDVAICNGESVTLTASGGTDYLWNTGETSASITINPIVTDIYTVTVFDSFGNSDSDNVTVTVNDLPSLTLSEDVTIFEGESTNLIVGGASTYLWNTGKTSNSIIVSPLETTTYTVTGFSTSNCESIAEVTVTVIPELNANAGNDVAICNGESVILTASGGTDYLWNTGETSASITINPIVTEIYTVTAFDSFGNSDSDSVTVTVNDLPSLTLSEDVTIFEGESTNLTVGGASTYLWNTGETSNSIVVSPLETTTYTVTGFSTSNCESIAEVTVTVIPKLNANAGNDVSICFGESVTLNASGGLGYVWSTGETSASVIVSPTETTIYTVTVFDEYGNSDTDSVKVSVNELPNITVSENITIIEGESTNLEVSGAESYLWNTGDTSNSILVSPTQTTTYNVIGMTNSCSSELKEVTVTVTPLFQASAGTDERVCDNENYEVVLTANEGDSYLWSTGETTQSIVVNPLSTSTYSVTVTQGEQSDTDDVKVYVDPSPVVSIANGESVDILNGDFVTLSASGANTYEWNNGGSQPNIAVSPSVTTTYEVKGYIGQCYDDKQVTVNVLQPVVADAGEDVLICLNEHTTLTATGGDDYVWSTGETTPTIVVSPNETTDYTVTVFNALDFDEATVRVEVDLNCVNDSTSPSPITDDEMEFAFDVYPNPASGTVNVKLSGTLIVSDINIYDVTGKLIKHSKITNENLSATTTTQIDISSLQSGVYFVKLIDKDRDITKKLIVE
ncbi:Ig-like domain-containing protein [Winogradskyella sp. PC D3.3]